MKYKEPLREGKLVKRYKRFFSDILFEGEVITAHLPNTGSLKSVPLVDSKCYFSTSDDPKRKLKYSLELIQTDSGLAGVNTRVPNTIVGEALEQKLIYGDYKYVQPEVKISDKSRIDFVISKKYPEIKKSKPVKFKYPEYLKDPDLDLHFIEVKNVTMVEGTKALFPDGVSERATKHLQELIKLKSLGYSAEVLFTVQREHVTEFSPATDIDPTYAKTLKEAIDKGVKATAYPVSMDTKEVKLINKPIPIRL